MNKTGCLLIFKQLQSIHLGIRGYGVLSETRIFITGQTMWGALTNTYGKSKKWSNGDFGDNENKKIFETVTCFYPSFSENYNKVMLPKFKNGEFYLGGHSEKKFRNEFVDSFISTAIQPVSLTAKDESLHEIEVILPKGKENKKQLYWSGLLWIKKDIKEDFLKEKETEIIVGGDSRYGLGRLRLEKVETTGDEVLKKWGIREVDNLAFNLLPEEERNEKTRIYNFLENKGYNFEGKLELFADFNFRNVVVPNADKPKLYIVPGSKVEEPKDGLKLNKSVYE